MHRIWVIGQLSILHLCITVCLYITHKSITKVYSSLHLQIYQFLLHCVYEQIKVVVKVVLNHLVCFESLVNDSSGE